MLVLCCGKSIRIQILLTSNALISAFIASIQLGSLEAPLYDWGSIVERLAIVDDGYVMWESLYLLGLCICLMDCLGAWVAFCEIEGLRSVSLGSTMVWSIGGSEGKSSNWSMVPSKEEVGTCKTVMGSGLSCAVKGKQPSYKMTFLEIEMALVLRSRVIYPFVFGLKPRKIEVVALGSNFFLLTIKVLEKHKQPNTLKEAIS